MPGEPRRNPATALLLDRRSPLPLYLQLKHHLIHLISSGAWEPGMPIPSIRQLAADLHLAATTVQRAYGELQDLGVLQGQAGRGVFVADLANDGSELLGERHGSLHDILGHAVSHAVSLGFSRQEIVSTVHLLINGRLGQDGPPRLVFVGSTTDAADKYRGLLADAFADLNPEVVGLPLDNVRDNPGVVLDRLEPIRCIVALVRAFAELRHLVTHRGTPIFALVVDLTTEAQQEIATTPVSEPIGVIAQQATITSARTVVRQFRPVSAADEDGIIWADIDDPRAVKRVLERCHTVAYTFGVRRQLPALAPGHRLIELTYLPTPTSLAQLRTVLAESVVLQPQASAAAR